MFILIIDDFYRTFKNYLKNKVIDNRYVKKILAEKKAYHEKNNYGRILFDDKMSLDDYLSIDNEVEFYKYLNDNYNKNNTNIEKSFLERLLEKNKKEFINKFDELDNNLEDSINNNNNHKKNNLYQINEFKKKDYNINDNNHDDSS